MTFAPLAGLVAAAHTPFAADGSLCLAAVEPQAELFARQGLLAAFIGGTTGESHSLSLDERRQLTARWLDVTRGSHLDVVVHVGCNCLGDARELAAQAQAVGARAIAALAPSYFKPADVTSLLAVCAEIAGGAPELPFYYYDIPSMTGLSLAMPEFLARGREAIPNLAGIKWTNVDLMAYQVCRHAAGEFDLPWGVDEAHLAGLALGARGAVGSTYSFAAPLYHRLRAAFAAGDLATAQAEQWRSVQLVALLKGYGFMPAAKATMTLLGAPMGPARLPHGNLTAGQRADLRRDLEQLGYFDWIRP